MAWIIAKTDTSKLHLKGYRYQAIVALSTQKNENRRAPDVQNYTRYCQNYDIWSYSKCARSLNYLKKICLNKSLGNGRIS